MPFRTLVKLVPTIKREIRFGSDSLYDRIHRRSGDSFDNFFTSYYSVIRSIGIVRSNRPRGANNVLATEKILKNIPYISHTYILYIHKKNKFQSRLNLMKIVTS